MRSIVKFFLLAAVLAVLAGWGLSAVADAQGPLAAVALLGAAASLPATLNPGSLAKLGTRMPFPSPVSFQGNFAASGSVSAEMPLNQRYHGIILQYKTNASQATIEADITEVRIKVNQKVVRVFSAAQANLINAFNGVTFNPGILPIFFSEPKRRTPEGEEFLSWPMFEDLGITSLRIEVDFGGAAAAPTLVAIPDYDLLKPVDQVTNPITRTAMHWVRTQTPCAAAFAINAPLTPANFIPNVNGYLHRIHSFDAVITEAKLRQGATTFWDLTTVQMLGLYQPRGLTKQAATFHVALDYTQQYTDGVYIPSLSNVAIDFATSGAAAGNAFASILEVRKAFDLS